MSIDSLPAVNATLNATSTVLLLIGYVLIRRGHFRTHAGIMIAACITSIAFLTCYTILHTHRPPRSFAVQGPIIRPIYYSILLTHVLLAAAVPPLVTVGVALAGRRRWAGHRSLSRWTLPIWLYVSVTGVIVYWMLYHI